MPETKTKAATAATQSPVVPQRDFQPLNAYCLALRKSRTGKFYVARSEWEGWFGKLVVTNERRVSGWLTSRDEALPVCKRYCDAHPGCLTTEQAARLLQTSAQHSAPKDFGACP